MAAARVASPQRAVEVDALQRAVDYSVEFVGVLYFAAAHYSNTIESSFLRVVLHCRSSGQKRISATFQGELPNAPLQIGRDQADRSHRVCRKLFFRRLSAYFPACAVEGRNIDRQG